MIFNIISQTNNPLFKLQQLPAAILHQAQFSPLGLVLGQHHLPFLAPSLALSDSLTSN